MKIYRPRSILKLILIGFSFVAFPLIFALASTALYLDKLVEQSQQAVLQTLKTTQSSYQLVSQVTDMERNARQFQVLGDSRLLELYEDSHRDIQSIIVNLANLSVDDTYKRLIQEFVDKELVIFKKLHTRPINPKNLQTHLQQTIADFVNLAALAQKILAESHRIISYELTVVETTAREAGHLLGWQVLALVLVTLMLMVIFTVLITRPIKQIDSAIRTLGKGQFNMPIQVTGPEDLVLLGQRLNWLRLRLLELEQDKNKFLRHVSHELKTPLTAIREGSELLLDEIAGTLHPEQREIAQILKKNSLQLQKLIENLLNFNAAHFQTLNLIVAQHRFKLLVEQVITNHSLAIRAKSLQIAKKLEDLTIEGDAEKLNSIVDNLLSNAIKYAPPMTTIYISVHANTHHIILEVADAGPGIAIADRDKIFDAFYQGQIRAQGSVKGSGLGLSIVKEYVSAHHGTVELVDTTANECPSTDSGNESALINSGNTLASTELLTKGACFRVTLPRDYVETF